MQVHWVHQRSKDEFKGATLRALLRLRSRFFAMAVDDDVVKSQVDLNVISPPPPLPGMMALVACHDGLAICSPTDPVA
jgi:hypothetical protein